MKKREGFSAVEGLLILIIVGIIGGVGWYVWTLNNADKSSQVNKKNYSGKNDCRDSIGLDKLSK